MKNSYIYWKRIQVLQSTPLTRASSFLFPFITNHVTKDEYMKEKEGKQCQISDLL
jgi:hypothetical protein